MQNNYFIRYVGKNGKTLILIVKHRNKKMLMDEDMVNKLFTIVFLNSIHEHKLVLTYSDSIHGNVYEIVLSKRDTVKAFTAARTRAFNYKRTRIKFVRLGIDKEELKELTNIDINSTELSLIHFIEHMKAKSPTVGYRKLI